MKSVLEEQRGWLMALLDALRYGTKREDAEFVDRLLSQHELERSDNLVERILVGPGFETFFLDAFREIQPFALMVSGLYRFLSSSATTIDADAHKFRVTTEGADLAFDFPLDGFPRPLQEVLATFNARQNDLQLTCVLGCRPAHRVVHPRTDEAENHAWQGVRPALGLRLLRPLHGPRRVLSPGVVRPHLHRASHRRPTQRVRGAPRPHHEPAPSALRAADLAGTRSDALRRRDQHMLDQWRT